MNILEFIQAMCDQNQASTFLDMRSPERDKPLCEPLQTFNLDKN